MVETRPMGTPRGSIASQRNERLSRDRLSQQHVCDVEDGQQMEGDPLHGGKLTSGAGRPHTG
jgi:hypothetical protein